MPAQTRFPVLASVALGACLLSLGGAAIAPAGAAPARPVVSGTLVGGAGMRVLAIAPSGSTTTATVASSGRFQIRLGKLAKGTTLQLIRRDGRYLGPVVLNAKRGVAVVGLSGRPGRLGRLVLRRAHARVAGATPARLVDPTRTARADATGRPLGAGRLGVVARAGKAAGQSFAASSVGRATQDGDGRPALAGADGDGDGLPNAIDADDNGNLVLDSFDPTTRQPSAGLFSTLYTSFTDALNVNATGVSVADIDRLVAGENFSNLVFYYPEEDVEGTVRGAHVDCGRLSYCRPGDGTAILGGLSESSPDLPRGGRWVDYRPDGSVFPNLERLSSFDGRGVRAAGIQPRATTAQIRPGDTYDVVFDTNRGAVHVPTTLSAYFVTTPAITAYSSGAAATSLSYPIDRNAPGASQSNPIVLSSDELALTFWRPQRSAIAGVDSGSFVDIGGLHYGVVATTPDGRREIGCRGFYSDLSPTLAEPSGSREGEEGTAALFPLTDRATDAAPDPGRTLSFTLDVAGCLAAAGADPSGTTVNLSLQATGESRPGGADRAAQNLSVRLPE